MPQTSHEFSFPRKSSVTLTWEDQPKTGFSVPDVQINPILSFDSEQLVQNSLNPESSNFEINRWEGYANSITDSWQNRLIHSDSLIGMVNLLNKGFKGLVQMIYMDPPFGIAFDANFSNQGTTTEGYLDEWKSGLSDYLENLRERFVICQQLLTHSGSIFVQIGETNLHYVRCLLDEIFGVGNFVSVITFRTAISTNKIQNIADYLLWYANDKPQMFRRPLFMDRPEEKSKKTFTYSTPNAAENAGQSFKPQELVKRITSTKKKPNVARFLYQGQKFIPPLGFEWKWTAAQMQQLADTDRLSIINNKLYGKRYPDDFPVMILTNVWTDTSTSTFAAHKHYSVHTNPKVIHRCMAMTTKPGDLVLDPTCGSGTTPYVAELCERRWIAFDTSPTAILGTVSWLLGSLFPINKWTENREDHEYKTITKISLSDIAKTNSAPDLYLFDQPKQQNRNNRLVSPFQIETITHFSQDLNPESNFNSENWAKKFQEYLQWNGICSPKGTLLKIVEIQQLSDQMDFDIPTDMHLFSGKLEQEQSILILGPLTGLCDESSWMEMLKSMVYRYPDAHFLIFLTLLTPTFYAFIQQIQLPNPYIIQTVLIHPDLICTGLRFSYHPEAFRLLGTACYSDKTKRPCIKFYDFSARNWEILQIENIAAWILGSTDEMQSFQSKSNNFPIFGPSYFQMPFFLNYTQKELQSIYQNPDSENLLHFLSENITQKKYLIGIDNRGTLHYGFI